MKVLHSNKKARVDYTIEKTYEAGIVLEGWEVKSLDSHAVNMSSAFVRIKLEEAFIVGMSIPSWKHGEAKSKEVEGRDRKLLLHRSEIRRIEEMIKAKSVACIPLKIYRNDANKIKVEIGIGKGRKKYDKRQKLKEKDMKRNISKDMLAGGMR